MKEAAGSGEQDKRDTAKTEGQAAQSALASLCKAYMRAGPTDRRLFLEDVRAAAPNLWRQVEAEFVAERLADVRVKRVQKAPTGRESAKSTHRAK